MAEPKDTKTLEMRVAELEDKISKLHITEDELKAYHKVSSLLGAAPQAAAAVPQPTALQCVISPIQQCFRWQPIIQRCWAECVPWAPGGCQPGGCSGPFIPGGGSGGFGGLGGG
jgi:hypothetical protein